MLSYQFYIQQLPWEFGGWISYAISYVETYQPTGRIDESLKMIRSYNLTHSSLFRYTAQLNQNTDPSSGGLLTPKPEHVVSAPIVRTHIMRRPPNMHCYWAQKNQYGSSEIIFPDEKHHLPPWRFQPAFCSSLVSLQLVSCFDRANILVTAMYSSSCFIFFHVQYSRKGIPLIPCQRR